MSSYNVHLECSKCQYVKEHHPTGKTDTGNLACNNSDNLDEDMGLEGKNETAYQPIEKKGHWGVIQLLFVFQLKRMYILC